MEQGIKKAVQLQKIKKKHYIVKNKNNHNIYYGSF